MSIASNKVMVRRLFEELWRDPDSFDLAEITTPDFKYDEDPVTGPTRVSGMPMALLVEIRLNRTAFPDLAVELREMAGSGNNVAALWRAGGTHTGAVRLGHGLTGGAEIAPTGRRFQTDGASVCRLVSGRIADIRSYYRPLSLLQQLALLSGHLDLSGFVGQPAA